MSVAESDVYFSSRPQAFEVLDVTGVAAGTRAAIRRLCRPDDRHGWVVAAYACAWAVGAGASLSANGLAMRAFGCALCVAALLGLSIALHEASHRLLFRNAKLNEAIGFLCGLPVLIALSAFRANHWLHHKRRGSGAEPVAETLDFALLRTLPAYCLGILIKSFGFVTALPVIALVKARGRQRCRIIVEYLLVIGAVLVAVREFAPQALWRIWGLPLLITALWSQVRAVAEHGLTAKGNVFTASRTVVSGRALQLAMCNINFHIEHHLFPNLPWYHLPKAHAMLKDEYRRAGASVYPSYARFFKDFLRASWRGIDPRKRLIRIGEPPQIRYAQCWEDADALIEGLDVRPGDTCLSIASAGDNTLALLTRDPARVVAVDRRPEQIACLELRVAAYRNLAHAELLELIGAVPSGRRKALYLRCRASLSAAARAFWDAHPRDIARGIGHAGKFERYLALFRRFVLPCIYRRGTVACLLAHRAPGQRPKFYAEAWNTARFRWLSRVFFSRFIMKRFGRDRECFCFAGGGIAAQVLERSRIALCTQDLATNSYMQWICAGRYLTALPFALRAENFERIRANLDRLEWHCGDLEGFLERSSADSIDRFNLSDVFEYLSPQACAGVMAQLSRVGRAGGRLMYFTLFANRPIPPAMTDRLRPLDALAADIHRRQKTFFYAGIVIGEPRKPRPH